MAAFVTRGSSIQPEVVTTIKTKGRSFTSSYKEETGAMESALSWASTNASHLSMAILFCTNNKSLCHTLISLNLRTSSIHNSINFTSSSIFIQWIPGNSDIPGNELNNKGAKESTTIDINTILLVSFSSYIQVINKMIHNVLPTYERNVIIYQHQKASCYSKEIKNRKDNVLLARLQSSHYPSLHQNLY